MDTSDPFACAPVAIDGMSRLARDRARWPQGVAQAAAARGMAADCAAVAKGEWSARLAAEALRSGARSRGAPQGWGWHWEPHAIYDLVSNLLPSADPALWGEIVWALGAHRQALGPVAQAAKADGEKTKKLRLPPREWPGGRESFALDSHFEVLWEGWLLARWCERYAIARQDEKKDAEAWREEFAECLRLWRAEGGSFSRQAVLSGVAFEKRERKIIAARGRQENYLSTALREPALGAHKAMALLRAGAPVDEREDHCVRIWLSRAVERDGGEELLALAADRGANLSEPSSFGSTPLRSAVFARKEPAVMFLARRLAEEAGEDSDSSAEALAGAARALAREEAQGLAQPMRAQESEWLAALLARHEAEEIARAAQAGVPEKEPLQGFGPGEGNGEEASRAPRGAPRL